MSRLCYQNQIFDQVFFEPLRSLSVILYAIESCWMDLLTVLKFRVESHGLSTNDSPQALKMIPNQPHLDELGLTPVRWCCRDYKATHV